MTPANAVSRATALKRIAARGLGDPLSPLGFEPGPGVSWLRDTGELLHVIALMPSWGSRNVQWGVVSAEIVPVLWEEKIDPRTVAASAMTGGPGGIHHPPACPGFKLEDRVTPEEIDTIGAALASDALRFEAWVRKLTTRRKLREFFLDNRERSDPRGFVIPSGLGLKLLTAAALAAVDGDPAAVELASKAEVALAKHRGGKITEGRLKRLQTLFATTLPNGL